PALYDPLIAKLITHAQTRADAIELQARALDCFAVEGIATNITFLSALHRNPRWLEGALSTGLIAAEFGARFQQRLCESDELLMRAAVAAAIHLTSHYRWARENSPPSSVALSVLQDSDRIDLTAISGRDGVVVEFNGRCTAIATDWQPGDPLWHGTIDHAPAHFKVTIADHSIALSQGGVRSSLRVLTPRQADLF
ncbi:acetyl/propionyl-CoA carboxylase subunit alpha, partial [Mesorhizobium sp. M7D.F.Ca.US.004.03.1.1]